MNFAVIFDMDGVIVDSNPFHKRGWKMFCEKHNIVLNETEWEEKVFGRTGSESLPIIFNTELTKEQITLYCDEINSNFRNLATEEILPLKGLKNFLDSLISNKISFAMATSAPPLNVVFVLNKTGLAGYFNHIVDDTQITKSKPDPEVFLKAAEKINMPPSKCIVIEDSFSGIQAAQSAGMKVIAVTTTHPAEKLSHTNLVINDFDELTIPILKSLLD